MKKATDADRGGGGPDRGASNGGSGLVEIVSGVIKRTILILVTPSKQQ